MLFQIEQAQRLYKQPDQSTYAGSEIEVGEQVEIGAVVTKNGMAWVPVRRCNGESGYVPGDTKGAQIKKMTVEQKEVAVFSESSTSSFVRLRLHMKDKIQVYPGVVENGSEQFVKIRDRSGTEGFMPGDTKVKTIPEVNKKVGSLNMLYGFIWFIVGLVVTFGTLAAASNGDGGGTYLIMWGPVLFGGIQFFKGLGQFVTAPI